MACVCIQKPADARLHILLPSSVARSTISIFDSQGALVLKQEVNSADKAIDVGALSPGLYLVRIETAGKSSSKFFVKE
ncbi:MAG: T9SS type A sorting domain-containing protein [Flavobacteriales bacterium]|nr:T9SS type A sorting domain-containing protein [Flavobacteriales bacterium]MBK7246156.1 T9SS type A sorting domain-containing protein [Flavobacteriales bacterium]MBK7286278.1 T9SS type A sorting domain-containing protein [Flavobacteriales bacterium]MBK9599430.1 T9SS type A sorting domain-containing protein [Flavobacteriales bacterium]QQS71856.1 MAG: T9SS type A sorting domain-containing protein [Flavobacteriales bacterium]